MEGMPKRGDIFEHASFLSSAHLPERVPLKCKVTKVAQGVVYYRPFYGVHEDGSEWLGAPSYTPLDRFPEIKL